VKKPAIMNYSFPLNSSKVCEFGFDLKKLEKGLVLEQMAKIVSLRKFLNDYLPINQFQVREEK
jgi:hypothetical protein